MAVGFFWYPFSMQRKQTPAKKTIRGGSRQIVSLGLTQAQEKELGEMLLDNAGRGDIYLQITEERKGDEPRTAKILVILASKAKDWGFDPRSCIHVGEIGV